MIQTFNNTGYWLLGVIIHGNIFDDVNDSGSVTLTKGLVNKIHAKQMSANYSIFLTEQGYQYAPYVPTQEGAPPGYYDNPASGTGYTPASGNGYAPASGNGYSPASGTGYYNQMAAPSTMYCPPSGQPIAVPPTTTILMTQPYNQMSPNIKVSIRLRHKRFQIKLSDFFILN